MKLIKKCIILIILLNLVLVTCSYAVSNTVVLNSTNTSETVINNSSSNITSEAIVTPNLDSNYVPLEIVTPNPNSNYVPLEKDEVEDYFASIAVEKESVTEFMEKIEGDKLLDAICNKQTALGNTWMEENRDTFAKMNIELYDGDNRDGAQMTAEVSCDLINNTNTVIKSSNNYIHTGISGACYITKKDGSEIGFSLGEIKISLKGDISGQGDIGVVDLSLVQQELVDEISLKNEFLRAADMNTSYAIDVIDLSMLQEYIVNN